MRTRAAFRASSPPRIVTGSPALVSLQLAAKRAFDIVLASTLLALLTPAMALIAVLVRADSRGEVIFRQRRAGRDGRPFTIYKFRTMVMGAARGPVSVDDPRVTTVGWVLRRTSFDELPQLLNVLKGDMSFVGPRPDTLGHVERYTPFQRRRLAFRPGITGWAQVRGRNDLSWEERIKLDVEYIENWSLARDLAVLVRTPAVVLAGTGVTATSKPSDGSPTQTEDVA